MATKALITPRGGSALQRDEARSGLEASGANIEVDLSFGTVVSAEDDELASLEAQGFRVKRLEGIERVSVGAYEFDVDAGPPELPDDLRIPDDLAPAWRHHIVQLSAPPGEDAMGMLEARGVDVVEGLGPFGLFVEGSPERVAALSDLPEVAWTGPFQPAYRLHPNLEGLTGDVRFVRVTVHPEDEVADVRQALESAGAEIARTARAGEDSPYTQFVVVLDAARIPDIARRPGVRWMEFASPEPGFDGEREVQIVAENLDGNPAPGTGPVQGYQGWLAGLGLSGAGVTVAICDTGVDAGANNNTTGHLDLRGRQVGFVDYTGGAAPRDTDGHGTHVAGIAVGNAASAQTEPAPANFLWGQGVAPGAGYVSQNALLGPWPPANFGALTRDAAANGARVMNNSWFDGGAAGGGYTANARTFDQLVRDPSPATPDLETLVIVFSAGNAGPNASTITPPKEAKNPITVGNSLTFRPGIGDVDDIRGIRRSSSRGPARDGRILPNVVAPGSDVSSAWSETGNTNRHGQPIAGTGTPDPANPANLLNQYAFMSGTSMSAPHVAGCVALLIEWWRNRTGGKDPSPALVKALLVNGAEDIAGGPSGRTNAAGNPVPLAAIPNNDQGWGRVSLENMLLQAPASDRGPRIFSDQRRAFTANGQEHTIRVAPVDPARPMRVTLVWTDAPGGAGANPALVNDLDLEVTEQGTGRVLKGNVFANGFSTTGGNFDSRNNVECVYVQNPSGIYDVTVIAANVTMNARPPFDAMAWQDFALVLENAEVPPAAPVAVVPVLDRSGSMQFLGYVDRTRASTRQFVDLLGVSDRLGIVSFGDDGRVEYPPAPPAALRTITGEPERAAARAEIDGIAFGGCTFMGDGILKARDLLAGVSGSQAMVLFSDGYDNKGCDAGNAAKPSAAQAAGMLPSGLPVYTCAMGPTADQVLLESIAAATTGRYYFMPTIDDLFEIYNYIRGQVTGTSIIVNESAMASRSRVPAVVDRLATRLTLTVAWGDSRLRFVPGDPRKPDEVSVRLRDPGGRLLHPDDAAVRRSQGDGYVLFDLVQPASGRWHVEVETVREDHLRYTVGGFVESPLRMVLQAPSSVIAGAPIDLTARVLDGKRHVRAFKPQATGLAPRSGVPTLLEKFKDDLARVPRPKVPGGDGMPRDVARLVALRNRRLAAGKEDLFATSASRIRMLPVKDPRNVARDGEVFGGRITETTERGTRNVAVTVSGSTQRTGRFVRKQLASVLVR